MLGEGLSGEHVICATHSASTVRAMADTRFRQTLEGWQSYVNYDWGWLDELLLDCYYCIWHMQIGGQKVFLWRQSPEIVLIVVAPESRCGFVPPVVPKTKIPRGPRYAALAGKVSNDYPNHIA